MAFASTPTLIVGGAPRVNLMPRAETERRARNGLIRRWGWGLVGALLLVVVATAGAFMLQTAAQQRLDTANAKTLDLLTQISTLKPVSQKLALESELAEFRTSAMGADLVWASLLTTVDKGLPDGVEVAGFVIEPGGVPAGEDRAAEIGAGGTLTLTSENPTDIVQLVRALRGIEGIITVDSWSADTSDAGFDYTVRVVFDQSAYTGAFAEVTE